MKKKMSLNKIATNDLRKVNGGRPPKVCPCACMPTEPGEPWTSDGDAYGVYIRYHG